jgi:4-amino-4-deoxy-L-arabinose transferase-like glycosyltransferase
MTPDRRTVLSGLLVALALGAILRGLWLTSDPPTYGAVGIVWHDEGAWVHNARNRALWGVWRTDAWNPVYIAPVFTAAEYVAFRAFGVGTWQARVVPLASGLFAVVALGIGLAAAVGRRAAVAGAVLLSTNYVFVMWNRAALMESTMTACIVGAWACYAVAVSRPRWGFAAGVMATMAWFSKAAAAFFVAAIALDALATLVAARSTRVQWALRLPASSATARGGAQATLWGLAASALLIVALFVVPHWADYRFYNWQMSVTRKPSYTLSAIVDRASWLPFVQGFLSRMWLVVVAAALATGAVVARWRSASPPERLLVLWLLAGFLELVAHDSGNERRYVMLVPAFVALSTLLLAHSSGVPASGQSRSRWAALPLAMFFAYLVVGTVVRVIWLPDVLAGNLRTAVRLSTLLAVALGVLTTWHWRRIDDWLMRTLAKWRIVAVAGTLVIVGDLWQYALWARHRSDLNYQASIAVGRLLQPGTLVHGKLANGLSLENRIRPVFVGRGFGNYDDRRSRDDIRYVLTYISPTIGFEGPVIRDVLDAYPRRMIVASLPVAETGSGADKVALLDKFGATQSP